MTGKWIAQAMQTGGGILLLLTAGASDAGTLTLGQIALGLVCAALLLTGGAILRRRCGKPAAKRRAPRRAAA